MIDEWESKAVFDHLASRRSGGRINHYWVIKNMMGLLMEDTIVKWNGGRDLAQCMNTCINQTDTQLSTLEAYFNLRHYSMFPNAGNVDDDGDKDQRGKGGETWQWWEILLFYCRNIGEMREALRQLSVAVRLQPTSLLLN